MSFFPRFRPPGPQPTNTLTTKSGGRVSNASRLPSKQLVTATTAGYNVRSSSPVKSSTPEINLDSNGLREPHPKRRKLDQHRNSQSTPQIVDESDEADQIIEEDFVQVKHVTEVPRDGFAESSQPAIHSGISRPAPSHTVSRMHGAEYNIVENLMSSKLPKNKKPKTRQKNRGYNGLPAEGCSFASSQTESVEMLDGELNADPKVKVPYKGTANLLPSRRSQTTSKASIGPDTADRSPYFSIPTSDKVPTIHGNHSIKFRGERCATEPRLRDQYRDSFGKPRGSPDSPDELESGEPNSRALSPVKSAGPQSPTKISQSDHTRRHSTEDELGSSHPNQGDITPTVFLEVANTIPRPKATKNRYPQEKPAPWDLPLHAYNFQGEIHVDDASALVYNDAERCYDIHCSGENLGRQCPGLRIRPDKLQNIIWAREGAKMRFKSSKIIDVDNVLDIELCGQKDVMKLNARLQEHGSYSVKGESRERMDQMFDRKIQDDLKSTRLLRFTPYKQPDDVELADLRLQRADQKRALDEHHQSNVKRPRLVQELLSDKKTNDKQGIHRDVFPNKTGIKKYGKMTERKTSSDFNLGDLNPLDDHLKHGLRPRNPNGALSKRLRGSSPFSVEPELPHEEIEKYSKVHGLGRRWSKPLVYPKEGKKRTTVEFDDLTRLDEGEFLNDSLIAFYLRYLEHQAEQNDPKKEEKNVYMFNTFFYASLTATKPGQRGINYEAVQKWTSRIDIFEYNFVVVPVHEAAHWYVAIICNLQALPRKLGGYDSDSVPGSGLPEETDLDQPFSDKLLVSSSLRTVASDENRQDAPDSASHATENPKEHDTTASFAEMSLEAPLKDTGINHLGPEIPVATVVEEAEQELLDGQLQQYADNGQDGGKSDAQEVQSADSKVEEILESDKPTPARLRPRKRKSLPATRVFDSSKPTILTFDSFGTAHPATVKALKLYLREEANVKRGMVIEEKDLQGVTAKQIPQQDNFCDCGLYLLGYMEKFFDNPRDFINKIMRRQWDVQKDWPNLGPSIMRTNIRGLLMGLGESHLQELDTARKARRANNVSKTSTGSNAGSKTGTSRSEPSNLDGVNSAETTPAKTKLEAAQPLSPDEPALESAENIKTHVEQASPLPEAGASESPGLDNDLAAQPPSSPNEAVSEAADDIDESNQPPQQQIPSTRQAALESALPIDEGVQQQRQPTPAVESDSVIETSIIDQVPAAEVPPPPRAAIEEPTAQSFMVPDSQPQSSEVPQSREVDEDPESFAISPELPSTIQDSQPPVPELSLKDLRKETTPPPHAKPKRHIESFSSPVVPLESRPNNREGHKSPGTPKASKKTHISTRSEQAKSSPETRSSKSRRPLLGSQPAIKGTNPKIIINLD
ncbi:MAG: hypothetical protein Q9168_007403 [Polycauliona sp. 1 TL-2023]